MEVLAIWEDKRNNSKRDLIHENLSSHIFGIMTVLTVSFFLLVNLNTLLERNSTGKKLTLASFVFLKHLLRPLTVFCQEEETR